MKTIVITAGGTREPIDEVRVITNISTGKLGSIIGNYALQAGFKVIYLAGIQAMVPAADKQSGADLEIIRFSSSGDLLEKVRAVFKQQQVDIVIHSAAIADYTPVQQTGKIRSGMDELLIRCVPAPRIVKEFKKLRPEVCLIMFKLEVNSHPDELTAIAYSRLKDNNADLIVANDLNDIKQGKHTGYLITPERVVTTFTGKEAIARAVVDYVKKFCGGLSGNCS